MDSTTVRQYMYLYLLMLTDALVADATLWLQVEDRGVTHGPIIINVDLGTQHQHLLLASMILNISMRQYPIWVFPLG